MAEPRLATGIWVSAYLRRCQGEGAFGAVVRKGAEEAGAIFLKINRLDGTCDLYGPAPQAMSEDEDGGWGGRRFERLMNGSPESEADERIARERSFDPDLWMVEIEDRQGRVFLD